MAVSNGTLGSVRKRVVILGGGFAGIHAALGLLGTVYGITQLAVDPVAQRTIGTSGWGSIGD